MATSAALPPLPSEIYAVFNGPIDQEAVTRIFNGLTAASTNSVKQFHLLFQSQGGGIGESIALYNFFRALTFDLTLYNTGTVASGATIAYLGAKKRKTSAHALFMIHRTETTTQFANTQTIKSLADSAVINDQRTEAILRQYIIMPAKNGLSSTTRIFFLLRKRLPRRAYLTKFVSSLRQREREFLTSRTHERQRKRAGQKKQWIPGMSPRERTISG
jgi:ATP-dependent Clp protease, protease subunit